MPALGQRPTFRNRYVRFSNRPVKHFQTIHRSTHGLVLLFGIGARALPSWGANSGYRSNTDER